MITIQIGSNDQCASCDSTLAEYVSPDAYGQYVEAAIERIKKEIPKVVVNLRKLKCNFYREKKKTNTL